MLRLRKVRGFREFAARAFRAWGVKVYRGLTLNLNPKSRVSARSFGFRVAGILQNPRP